MFSNSLSIEATLYRSIEALHKAGRYTERNDKIAALARHLDEFSTDPSEFSDLAAQLDVILEWGSNPDGTPEVTLISRIRAEQNAEVIMKNWELVAEGHWRSVHGCHVVDGSIKDQCAKCKGTGKRGRGKCGSCGGQGQRRRRCEVPMVKGCLTTSVPPDCSLKMAMAMQDAARDPGTVVEFRPERTGYDTEYIGYLAKNREFGKASFDLARRAVLRRLRHHACPKAVSVLLPGKLFGTDDSVHDALRRAGEHERESDIVKEADDARLRRAERSAATSRGA